MNRLIICLLAVLTLHGTCRADITMLPAEHSKALHDISRFHEVHSASDLPQAVRALCRDDKRWFAFWRLIWAVTDGEYYVVHFEGSGDNPIYYVVIAKLKPGRSKPSFTWRVAGGKSPSDYRAFLGSLE